MVVVELRIRVIGCEARYSVIGDPVFMKYTSLLLVMRSLTLVGYVIFSLDIYGKINDFIDKTTRKNSPTYMSQ